MSAPTKDVLQPNQVETQGIQTLDDTEQQAANALYASVAQSTGSAIDNPSVTPEHVIPAAATNPLKGHDFTKYELVLPNQQKGTSQAQPNMLPSSHSSHQIAETAQGVIKTLSDELKFAVNQEGSELGLYETPGIKLLGQVDSRMRKKAGLLNAELKMTK